MRGENIVAEFNKEQMAEEDTQHGRFLTFQLGPEIFGIEISYVTEIIGMQEITQIPEVPAYIKGIINLRGKIIPLIDVRLKFHKDEAPYNDRTCIIVININDISAGLIVDQVSEVCTIQDEDIALPPDNRTGMENRYIKGIGKINNGVTLLLDCEKILTADESALIASI